MKTLILIASLFAHDGDTLVNGEQRIRLHGMDAPELSQTCDNGKTTCGKESRDRLQALIESGHVECVEHTLDRWKRSVARCTVDGEDVSQIMVREGQALAFRKYSKDYVQDEALAELNKVGMWKASYIAPWSWRKGERW